MDPHTATCIKAYEELRTEQLPTVIYSTAEWTKFSTTVAQALGSDAKDDIEALEFVATSQNLQVPDMIRNLFAKEVKHTVVVKTKSIKEEMLKFL